MITEDNNNIYIEEKKDLKKLIKIKSSRYGSNSDIYYYKELLLKIYNHLAFISERKNIEHISKLNINNIAIPQKFIFIEERFVGYSMDYKKGIVLPKVKETTNYSQFISNLNEIGETIKELSIHNIEMRDVNCFNILYDKKNNLFNIVDVDNYKENRFKKLEELYKDNIFTFATTLLNCISYNNIIYDSVIFIELQNILSKGINNKLDMTTIFNNIKIFLENYSNKEINTIKEFRKVLKK